VPRTTIDIDAGVLKDLKRRQRITGQTLGALASELLARALADDDAAVPPPFAWKSAPMGARVDLEDKDAVFDALGRT
jgi:hypothetical protein